jgi:hypothetical protein
LLVVVKQRIEEHQLGARVRDVPQLIGRLIARDALPTRRPGGFASRWLASLWRGWATLVTLLLQLLSKLLKGMAWNAQRWTA